jgi:hypothetical protein
MTIARSVSKLGKRGLQHIFCLLADISTIVPERRYAHLSEISIESTGVSYMTSLVYFALRYTFPIEKSLTFSRLSDGAKKRTAIYLRALCPFSR